MIKSSAICAGKRMFKGKRILIVGAHPDDIEFGLGATLNQIKDEDIKIVVFSSTTNLNGNVILEELKNSMRIYGLPFTLITDIENMNFIAQERDVKQKLFDIKKEFKPDIIFTTSKRSYNPDHQVLGISCLNVFQEQTVLFYEVVRGDYEHHANFYNKVTEDDSVVKVQALMQYVTQTKREYMRPEIIQSQMVFRGSQCSAHLAESFEVGRIIL